MNEMMDDMKNMMNNFNGMMKNLKEQESSVDQK